MKKEELTLEDLTSKEQEKTRKKIINQQYYRITRCLWELQALIKYNTALELYKDRPPKRVDRNSAYIHFDGSIINIKYTGCNLVMDLMDLPKEKRECVLKEKKKTWAKYFFRNKSMEVMNNIIDESDIDKETGEILYATVPQEEQNTVHYGFDLFEDAIF